MEPTGSERLKRAIPWGVAGLRGGPWWRRCRGDFPWAGSRGTGATLPGEAGLQAEANPSAPPWTDPGWRHRRTLAVLGIPTPRSVLHPPHEAADHGGAGSWRCWAAKLARKQAGFGLHGAMGTLAAQDRRPQAGM